MEERMASDSCQDPAHHFEWAVKFSHAAESSLPSVKFHFG